MTTTDPRKQRKLWYIIGSVLIVIFLVFGANALKKSMTPYVGFNEARDGSSKVQIAGSLVAGSAEYLDQTRQLRFVLADEQGQTLPVLYSGVTPGNFEEATQIVLVGSYQDGVFNAEQMLTKCPSKYQGLDARKHKQQ
jgi:cytochrome c-type biogenesis protein CcmE